MQPPGSDAGRGRALVAGEDQAAVAPAARALREAGWSVVSSSLAGAAAEAHRELPDVVLCDVTLTGLTGLAAVAGLLEEDETRHIPLVLLVSATDDEVVARGIEMGVRDYIRAPLEPIDLLLRCHGAERANRARRELEVLSAARDISERVAAETRMRDWQERLRLSFDNAPIGKALVGLDGSWLEVNPALCRLLGYTAKELGAMTFQDVTHPDDLEADLALVGQLVAGEIATYTMAKRYYRKDGATVWAQLHVSLVRDSAGDPQYFISQVQDVSEQHFRDEERLQIAEELAAHNEMLDAAVRASTVSEERYLAVIDQLPDTITYVFDSDHRVVQVGGPGISTRPFTLEQVVGKRPEGFLRERDAAVINRHLDRAFEGQIVNTVEFSETSGRDLLLNMMLVEHDRIGSEVIVMSRDITTMKDRERLLAQAETRWRAAFELAPVAMLEIDFNGKVLAGNTALQALTGRKLADLVGKRLADFVHPDDRDIIEARTLLRRAGLEPEGVVQHRLCRPDGSTAWVAGRSSVLSREGAGHALAHLIDITAEKAHRENVEKERARFTALVEHGSDLIAVLDANLVLRYASPAYKDIFGVDPDATLGTSYDDRAHPEDRERLGSILKGLAGQPGGVVTYEFRARHASGTWRTLEVTASNHLDDPAVAGLVCNCRDVTDRVEVAERLAYQALHDGLTGLGNRGLLMDRLDSALARAERSRSECALLFLDLDMFKLVNDNFGHAAGDRVLVEVGERLRSVVRPSDTVVRLGGDEFVVLVEDVETERFVTDIAERVSRALCAPFSLPGHDVSIGCSIGIAFSGRHHQAEALLHEADMALYRSRKKGQERWEVYEQGSPAVAGPG